MTIENLNFLCTMAFYSDETKFYRVILNTGERKKKKLMEYTKYSMKNKT